MKERKAEEMSYTEFEYSRWLDLTRRMFRSFPAILVYNQVDNCLAQVSDKQWENGFPAKIFNEEQSPRITKSKGIKRKIIDDKLKITDIAKKYGLDVRRGKVECPFHEDTDPSMSFNDEKNVFHCFGCGLSGDIVNFIGRMEDLKRGKNGEKGS